MSKRNVTMADVAQKAGVSSMTVSRVINHKGEISAATRRRVLQAIAELGYRPSRVARGLATNKTMQVGLVVPDISNPFFAQIALGAQNAAWDQNYNVLLLNTMEDTAREKAILHLLEESQVDGVILCSPRLLQAELQPLLHKLKATVLINRTLAGSQADSICVDNAGGVRQAVAHFLSIGRRNIGYLSGPPNSVSGQQRLDGLQAALAEANVPLNAAWLLPCEPTFNGGESAAFELLSAHPEINALLCFNDLTAVGALAACARLNRSAPDDVAVIGFDDIPLAKLVNPSLTTLQAPMYQLGETAMTMLLDRITAERDAKTIVFEQTLILRESA